MFNRPGLHRFSVVVTGQGPDVILIPGLATSGEVWDATVKHLAPSHRVHVVHIAEFGGADAGRNKADDDMLAALAAEMEQYLAGLERPAVIGHSLGGLLMRGRDQPRRTGAGPNHR